MTHNASSSPVAVTAYEFVSGCGMSKTDLCEDLARNRRALEPIRLFELPFDTVVGEVTHPLPPIREELQAYETRNAQLALAALKHGLREAVLKAIDRYGESRFGPVLATSTSGLYESEAAYAHYRESGRMPDDFNFICRHVYQATAQFLQLELGLGGPCYAISTACSSSTKALAAGQRLINAGICDAVLAEGVDTLCRLTLLGFQSLELVSSQPCAPMDIDRQGINIGEGAGLLLLEKTNVSYKHLPHILAVGESSDAHHMSAPHPEGKGAALAMHFALEAAGLKPDAIDYINLHATNAA
ncbi:MAG: beta-ketoacyl synthase N-terminal-like domain-containing protein [Pseudomonadota bacterium]